MTPRVGTPYVSIIVPTYNEERILEHLASSLAGLPDAEYIFVDGGSTDSTPCLLEEITGVLPLARWMCTQRGRGQQMNAGASVAAGEWLIFLHADTHLPHESYTWFVQHTRRMPGLQAGAFRFRVDHERPVYRYLELYVHVRCTLGKLPFGDQAIFARREVFERLGGFRNDFPVMEDMEFVRRANKLSGFSVIDAPVYTSARRFEAEGYLRRTCGNLLLQIQYLFGRHPRDLARLYYR